MQQYFAIPKYDKKPIYKNLATQYHYFTNTFGYYHMIKAGNPSYPKKNLCTEAIEAWKLVKKKTKNEIDEKIKEYLITSIPIQSYVSQLFCNSNQASTLIHETRLISMASITIVVDEMVSKNAAAQKRSLSIKKENAEKLIELQEIYKHYCLALVKGVKQFAAMFFYNSIVTLQDDKAKVPLGIPAIGKIFQIMQTINKTVTFTNHDFPIETHQKLIPSIYLAIDPLDSNDTLCKGQLAIFVHPQYNVGTSSNTHMVDLITLTNQKSFNNIFKNNNQVKPIWVLLVDRGPDEHSRYLKNILRYSKFFQYLDLDYLIVRMHTPGQLAYNLVERAMYTFSGKLASITLPIDTFGSHLDSQDKYVNDTLSPFQIENNEEESIAFWKWLEKYVQICQYSFDIQKCDNLTCCHPKRNEESAAFLAENNGFLPPVSKGRDGHFFNSVHILQYANLLKLPAYDAHCPSILPEMHHRLYCNVCGKYFSTLKMITTHKKSEHMKQKKHKEHKRTILSNLFDDFSLNLTLAIPEISYCSSISDNE
ncbi:42462_t:CDS:2 [Gigaspora margarita]|uniref:42462_t:CDS:1 n=1 Tax=Gigaspora margarita TaxID=4874 RepID=A0ABN7W8I5_GIGMA|nr:42462_t:CDS:2 [Gigaspora margarita]